MPRDATPAAPSGGAPAGRLRFYLSLGDSLGFGFSEARLAALLAAHDYTAAAFGGYTADVATSLKVGDPGLVVTNLSCPGETTTSYLHGGCPFTTRGKLTLHTWYTGPQAAAAESYLQARRGERGLVTVSLGSNDLIGLLTRCRGFTAACLLAQVTPTLTALRTNLTTALLELRQADPAAELVALAPYNPFAVTVAASDALALALDSAISAAAAPAGARVADAYPAFNGGGGAGQICQLTAYCTPLHDIHPTAAGYRVIARTLLATITAGAGGP